MVCRPTMTPSPSPSSPGSRRLAGLFVYDVEYGVERLARCLRSLPPVSDSATAFMWVMRPSVSVEMTASPMLASVIRSRSPCSAISVMAAAAPRNAAAAAP